MKVFLIIIALAFLTSCKEGPNIAICIVDPDTASLQCSKDGVGFTIPIKEAKDYFAISFDDFKKVVDYCKMNQGQQD